MLDDVYRALDKTEQASRAGRERMAAVARFRDRAGLLVGRGEAVDGKVTVEATSKSALNALTIDPRAMRLSSEELVEGIREAYQAAVDDLSQQTRHLLDEVGLSAHTSPESMAAMRADAEGMSRDFTTSVRSAAQQLDELARRKRG